MHKGAGDDHALDLVGAFDELQQARVTHLLFHRVVLHNVGVLNQTMIAIARKTLTISPRMPNNGYFTSPCSPIHNPPLY